MPYTPTSFFSVECKPVFYFFIEKNFLVDERGIYVFIFIFENFFEKKIKNFSR